MRLSKSQTIRSGIMAVCTICLDDEESTITTPCNHIFHINCLVQWFHADRHRHKSCPVCRGRFEKLFVSTIQWAWLTHGQEEVTYDEMLEDYTRYFGQAIDSENAAEQMSLNARRRRRRSTPYNGRLTAPATIEVFEDAIPFRYIKCSACSLNIGRTNLFMFRCGHSFHIQCAMQIDTMSLDDLRRLNRHVNFCEVCTQPTPSDTSRMNRVNDAYILS